MVPPNVLDLSSTFSHSYKSEEFSDEEYSPLNIEVLSCQSHCKSWCSLSEIMEGLKMPMKSLRLCLLRVKPSQFQVIMVIGSAAGEASTIEVDLSELGSFLLVH